MAAGGNDPFEHETEYSRNVEGLSFRRAVTNTCQKLAFAPGNRVIFGEDLEKEKKIQESTTIKEETLAFEGNAFKKLADGKFGVVVRKGTAANSGDTISVTKKDGSVSEVVLGEMVEENKWGERIFKIVPQKK